jgi:transcriptional regulator with XRE-family HTH domain
MLSCEPMASSRRRIAPRTSPKGELIRALRIERNLTQAYVARKAGISLWQLSRIECGNAEPTRDTLERLAPILGVTAAYLDVRALSEAIAEQATDPVARTVIERLLAMHDRIATMSDRELKRLLRVLDRIERGGGT